MKSSTKKTMDSLLDEKDKAYRDYVKCLRDMHAATEKEIDARLAHEERANAERIKFKDLLKADPISIEAMIRTNTADTLKVWIEVEKSSRLMKLNLQVAGAGLDGIRQEIEIRKLSMGEL